jgi:hypothetical protein
MPEEGARANLTRADPARAGAPSSPLLDHILSAGDRIKARFQQALIDVIAWSA